MQRKQRTNKVVHAKTSTAPPTRASAGTNQVHSSLAFSKPIHFCRRHTEPRRAGGDAGGDGICLLGSVGDGMLGGRDWTSTTGTGITMSSSVTPPRAAPAAAVPDAASACKDATIASEAAEFVPARMSATTLIDAGTTVTEMASGSTEATAASAYTKAGLLKSATSPARVYCCLTLYTTAAPGASGGRGGGGAGGGWRGGLGGNGGGDGGGGDGGG